MPIRLVRYDVMWTKEYTACIYAPPGMTYDQIHDMAEATSHEIDSTWVEKDWLVDVYDESDPLNIVVFDDERALDEEGLPISKALRDNYVLVPADDGSQLVAPEEATWWLCDSDSEEN